MQKCKNCEEQCDDNYYTSFNNDVHCQECYESDKASATKMIQFNPGGEVEEHFFDENFNFLEPGEGLPEPIKEVFWKQSDGWRGYTDWKLKDGFIELTNGWITGHPDETTKRKAELGDYFQDLMDGELIPPCKIYWVFGQTSNVFSQSSAIIIDEENKKKVEEWLLRINGGLEEFQEMFK